MKLKKIFVYLIFGLIATTILFGYLANRDISKIYGGLTQAVDPNRFTPQQGPLAITNVNVLAAESDRFIPNQNVIIKQGKIISIGDQEPNDSKLNILDGSGKYLIPGLSDSHVHLFKSPNDLLLYIANGVTQIREMIGEPDHLQWRKEITKGRLGPDMFIASPRIGSFDTMEGMFMTWTQGFLNINNAADAEREVKRLHSQGYDAVKIYSQINRETYFAVTKTAKSLDMKIVGHAPWSLELTDIYPNQHELAHLEELMNAINREFGGFKSVQSEEFLAFVSKRSDEVAKELNRSEIAITTTLWLVESFVRQKFELDEVLREVELEYENPGISEWTPRVPQGGLGWLPEVNRYQLNGDESDERLMVVRKYWQTYAKACQIILTALINNNVKILAGTDTNLPPTVPGFSLHDEFKSLNNAGMSAQQILKAATTTPGKFLGNNTGKIEVNYTANLVLLDQNPLVDIANTRTINSVILNGEVLDRKLLDEILSAVREANNTSRTIDINKYLN